MGDLASGGLGGGVGDKGIGFELRERLSGVEGGLGNTQALLLGCVGLGAEGVAVA